MAAIARAATKAAFDALDTFNVKRALKLGHQLKKLRHSSGFEVLALAYAADEKLDDAIAMLEEGVKVVPSVWILWQLLGNYYSDCDRYAESLICYHRALECPKVDSDSVHLNASIALGRAGKYEEALAEVQQVTELELKPRAILQKMYILNCVRQFIRDVSYAHSPNSQYMTVLIRGDWSEPLEGESEAPGLRNIRGCGGNGRD